MERPRYLIAAVERSLSVLDCFTTDRPELTLMEICEQLSEQKGTVFRFLSTLAYLGYVEVDPESRRYRLGRKVIVLGQTALESMDLRRCALPYLHRLSEEVNENVNFSILDQSEIVYLERIVSRQFLNLSLRVGSRLSVHCSSMGKVLTAFLPEDEQEEIIRSLTFQRHTAKTICGPNEFRAELARVRAQGYAVSDEELVEGLFTIGAPVWGWDGKVKAAINVSAPASRLTAQRLEEVVKPALLAAAEGVSTALGAEGRRPGQTKSVERMSD